MKWIGAHVSISGGVENAPVNASRIGAKAFGMFTKNQRQWQAAPYTELSIQRFRDALSKYGFAPSRVLAHDGYLINLANPDRELRKQSLLAFEDEMKRCQQLGIALLNFHPGSHLNKISVKGGLHMVADSINQVLDKTQGVSPIIETTAGQGTNLGRTFEEIAEIIDRVEDKTRIGVCVDTCHVFAAGYDIRTPDGYHGMWNTFDKVIGYKYLKGMHLNDSKGAMNSHLDRHESLGKGHLGHELFKIIMNDSHLDNLPIILETPDDSLWPVEINNLYSYASGV